MTNMTTTTRNEQPTLSDDPTVLRSDIEDARARLGDTVDELRYRLDVKTRAKESAQRARARVSSASQAAAGAASRRKTVLLAGGSVAFAAVCGASVLAWRRRDR